MQVQLTLLGQDELAFDAAFAGARREALDERCWVERCAGWLSGDARLFQALSSTTRWQRDRRTMYEREVDVPRLTARFPEHGPGHPILAAMARCLSERYGQRLDAVSAALYRDGRDSVAPHGDRVGRAIDRCVVAIVSLGAPRRFLLAPAAGGPSRVYTLGFGDLLVMGGACQRTWRHAVPKVVHAEPRISVQFRPAAAHSG